MLVGESVQRIQVSSMASAIATAFMIPVVFLCASDSREKLLHEVDCFCGMKISLKNLFSVLASV